MLRTPEAVIADDLDALLAAGAALHTGLVAADGRPLVSRGFGLVITGRDPLSVQFLVPATTVLALDPASVTAPFTAALTVSSVRAFRSLQLKGTATGLRVATDDELAAAHRQLEPLIDSLAEVGQSREALVRMIPSALWACELQVADAFDQTPGPGAGRTLDGVAT
jgi:hypothetical protein